MRHRPQASGFTLIELLIVVAIIGIIAAIAVPLLLRARISGNEASAIASMRTVLSAQQDYSALYRGYSDDLNVLASVCPGQQLPFVSPDIGQNGVLKSGYIFTLASGLGANPGPIDCFGNATTSAFYVTAAPQNVGLTGFRGFAANAQSAIWQDTTGAVPTEPFTPGATVSVLGR
jgi:type IV pilus assembly protein PilA